MHFLESSALSNINIEEIFIAQIESIIAYDKEQNMEEEKN